MNAAAGAQDRAPILRGREEQLTALGGHIAHAAAGHGGVVFLTGSAGHGKTQLLAEATTMARRAGVRVGVGTNLPGDQMIQMGALLTALFGGADPLLAGGGPQTLQALPEQRYWLLEQLESLLEDAALETPLMVTLDDVQWGDGGGCAAVRVLARRLAALPILWILAFRPDEVPPGIQIGLDELERRGARRLVVGALPEPAVGQVVTDLLQSRPDADVLGLAGRAHGSPFLLVELVRGLVEDGLVRTVEGNAQLLDARLPARVRDGMRDRLQRLSTDARRAAQVASVVGGGFSFSWLAGMLDLAPAALLEPVGELLRAELLVDAGDGLAFRHDLLREAVLETLPLSTRRALKRQAADVLMASGVSGLDVAGLLAEGAEPGDAAAVAALLQAVVELGPRDPGAAADLGRRALDVAAPDDPQRGPLVAQTALLLYAADRAEEGQRFADAALGTALPPEQQAEIRLSIARMYSVPADVRVANGRAALDLQDISTQVRALHLAWLSHNLLGVGRVADARAVVDGAEDFVSTSGDERAAFRLAVVRATLDVVDGRYDAGLRRMDEMRASARAGEFDPALEVLRSETLAAVDRLDDSLGVIAEGLASAQEGRHAYALRVWEQYRGRRLLELGRLADAAAALEGALGSDTAELGVHGADAPAVVALGRVAIHTADDRLGRICRGLAQTLLETAAPEVRRHAAWLLMQQAMARAEPEAARDVLERLGADSAIAVLPQIRFDPTDEPQLVRLALAIGDDDLADGAVRTAEARARDNPDVALLVATAEHARGLRTADLGALATAAQLFGTTSRPLAYASALEDLGRQQVLHGSRDEGIASLGRALELHVEAGATWDAARLRGRLRTLGVRRRLARPSRPAGGWAGLTDSELTVARLVAQGLTNRDAAARMFLSPHTVSMHLRHAFAKLDINSRVELGRVVREHDERDAPPASG